MAEATLKNTKGTIAVNIKFKNKLPKGSTTSALGPIINPTIPPIITEISNIIDHL